MASQIANTTYNLNKQVNVFCTTLSVADLKKYSKDKLPSNSVIFSSLVDEGGYDTGKTSVLLSDYNGQVLPMTFSIDTNKYFKVSEDTNTISLDADEISEDVKADIQSDIKTKLSSSFTNNILQKINIDLTSDSKDFDLFKNDFNNVNSFKDVIDVYNKLIIQLINEINQLKDNTVNSKKQTTEAPETGGTGSNAPGIADDDMDTEPGGNDEHLVPKSSERQSYALYDTNNDTNN